jgi:hypothetical protein
VQPRAAARFRDPADLCGELRGAFDVDLASSMSKRRRNRLAAIVPPVPPPRITICFLAISARLLGVH